MSSTRLIQHRKKRLMSEINVVPYIDVMLVLLVIFMVTTPMLTEGVKVDLPEAEARQVESDDQENFVLTVDAKGRYFVNEDKRPSKGQQIYAKAAAVLRHRPDTLFLVRGDKEVEYQVDVKAMVLLQQAGVPSVGLVTHTPEGGK